MALRLLVVIVYESLNEKTNKLDDLISIIKFHEEQHMEASNDPETGVNNPVDKCMSLNYNACVPLLQRALQIEIEKNKLLEERLSKIETILKNNNNFTLYMLFLYLLHRIFTHGLHVCVFILL